MLLLVFDLEEIVRDSPLRPVLDPERFGTDDEEHPPIQPPFLPFVLTVSGLEQWLQKLLMRVHLGQPTIQSPDQNGNPITIGKTVNERCII